MTNEKQANKAQKITLFNVFEIIKNGGATLNKNGEAVAFEKFITAEHGDFDGFAFVNLFHEHFDKRNAIYTTESDDEANAITPFGTFHAGADGVTAYFFSEQPKKVVYFNRSVYFI